MKDVNGKIWNLSLSVGAIKRVRENLGIDLFDLEKLANGETFQALANDIVLLVNVCYLIVRPQADAAGVSDEQFGELISTPESIEAMTSELVDAIVNFIPNRKKREIAKAILEKTRQTEEMALQKAMQKISEMKPETLIESALNSQENVASNPGPSA